MDNQNIEPKHKRRIHYSGNHPTKFDEKYKEHDPKKYQETILHVISKGMTPAGMHISIMVDEILDFLSIKPGQIGLDATLGYGGHTKAMLEKLEGKGHIYALDIDPIEIEATKRRLSDMGYNEDIFTAQNINFRACDEALPNGVKADFLLADLGVSSMQIDNPNRGFSFKNDGPLDLRMNPNQGRSAADILYDLTEEEIKGMLIENADEPYASEIAYGIAIRKCLGKINTTKELYQTISKALSFIKPSEREEAIKKSAQRTMQAIRIDVNQEFEALYEFLEKLPSIMAPRGRIAILTFHSGEDRLVKKAFKEYVKQGVFESCCRDVIRPSEKELFRNPRSKSTKMRWAIMK